MNSRLLISRVCRPLSMAQWRGLSAFETKYENILVSMTGAANNVALVQLNRPRAYNALNSALMSELTSALTSLDSDSTCRAIVLTGNEKAFAAGADIKEMADKKFAFTYGKDFLAGWGAIAQLGTPLIAAVNGHALGGGCEVAMSCDIIYAGDKANFGQPEIKIGTIPGGGGTQRLTHAVGKSLAMELMLTGDNFSAHDALARGLVSKVYPAAEVVDKAIALADKIAAKSPLMVKMAKEAINAAYETPLQHGLQFERRLFHATFATADQKEGMGAFAEKRTPNFTGE